LSDPAASKRKPGVLRNTALNMGGQVALVLMGAVGSLVNARALGPELLGVLGVTFILADFGRPLTSFTHVPSIMEVHRGQEPDVVFATSLAIKLCLSALFSVVVWLAAPMLAETFHLPPDTVLLASGIVIVSSFYEVGAARLESENRMARSNLILAAGTSVGVVALVAFYVLGMLTVYTSIAAVVLANLAMSVGSILFVRWPFHARFDRKLGLAMARYGSRILVTALVAQALLQAETLLISHFVNNHDAGVFTVVFGLALLMVTSAQAVGVAVTPELSKQESAGVDTTPAYQRATLISLVVSCALAAGLILLGRWILGIYGAGYEEGYLPLVVLTVFGTCGALAVPAAAMLNVHGHAGTQMRIGLTLVLLNLVLSLALIQRFGLVGAAWALASVFALGMVASWVMVRRLTGAMPFGGAAFQRTGWRGEQVAPRQP
jgi:O-antigen/teichoic acid export membrane protein